MLFRPRLSLLALVKFEATFLHSQRASNLTSDSNINSAYYNGQKEKQTLLLLYLPVALSALSPASSSSYTTADSDSDSDLDGDGDGDGDEAGDGAGFQAVAFLSPNFFIRRNFHLTRVCAGSKFGTFGLELGNSNSNSNLRSNLNWLLPSVTPRAPAPAPAPFPSTTLKLLSRSAYYYRQISTVCYLCLLLLQIHSPLSSRPRSRPLLPLLCFCWP